jgi:glycosyltransferase involved in cell wall biosynthesis
MEQHMSSISYVIPCYNEEKNIQSCIYSIKADASRHPDLRYEIIVVDNNSTDSSTHKARVAGADYVVSETKKGVVHARNRGTEFARYEIVANIDADNNIPIGWTEIALNEIDGQVGIAAISGPLRYDNVGWHIHLGTKLFYWFARVFHVIAGPTVQGGNYVIRKSIWKQMGGYDTSYKFYGEDTRTAQLASKYGKVKLVPKLWINSSSRRLKNQGLISTIWSYTANYFSVSLFSKNVTDDYKDFR